MEHLVGLLRVLVVRGVNLAYRDARGSDPYVVLRMGSQFKCLRPKYVRHPEGPSPLKTAFNARRMLLVNEIVILCANAAKSEPAQEHTMKKVKTSVKKKNVNPEWNESLTLSISDPTQQIKLVVYDKDLFSRDDKMGEAEFDIQPFVEAVNMNLAGTPNGTIIRTVSPTRQNCLADESCIIWKDGKVVQDVILRLRNVESGELELQLMWVDIPRF